ncbi:hypothetical protein TBK1r_61710 [Stieleria magnilauensis]|uniref:Uncharacterized protein n=1 Tax=Stieleria magnilauensis TaxID=2527963 RepID=A0ABX5XYN1_9BACT|nr:hypothetical protein TBK1r_61710 [Planctomycetes bacterium TBK1r]
MTRPRRVSKQIALEPSDPACRRDWIGISIGNTDYPAAGGLIRCDPSRGRGEFATGSPEVALR